MSTTEYKVQKPTLIIRQNNSTIECEPPIHLKHIDNNELLYALEYYYNNRQYDLPGLWHVFSRIDLLNQFNQYS